MSTTGPNILAVVGDTDHWSPTNRGLGIYTDGRLRSVRKDTTGYTSIFTAGSRTPAAGLSYWAEFQWLSGVGAENMMGLLLASDIATYLAAAFWNSPNGPSYQSNGVIRYNAASQQTGLTNLTTSNRLGVKLYVAAGVTTIQFYTIAITAGVGVATAAGTPVSVATGAFALAWTASSSTAAESALFVDRDDLVALPADCHPWGAAARIADCGGYSPTSAGFASLGTNIVTDVYGRTATATANTSNQARFGGSSRVANAIYYVEFAFEVNGGAGSVASVGLNSSSGSLNNQVGSSATSWGYLATGQTRHNSVNSAVLATYTTIDRPGYYWNPVTGNLWLAKNGVPLSGNPATGTGAHYNNAIGDLLPAASPGGSGTNRMRACTHARDQVNRANYAIAWDGADVLPDQHFRGLLNGDTTMRMSFWPQLALGPRSSAGAPIGSVEIANQDGRYDALIDYNLRNQTLALYEFAADQIDYFARGLCDFVEARDESVLRVLARGADAFLDKRVGTELLTVGRIAYAPTYPTPNFADTFRCADTPFVQFEVIDQGLVVTTWRRATTAACEGGFKRTIGFGTGKQSVKDLQTYRSLGTIALTNAAMSAWAGPVLTGWTLTQTAPNGTVTQNLGATRFFRSAAGPTARAAQAATAPAGSTSIFVRFTVLAFVGGSLTFSHTGGGSTTVPIGETGTFWVRIGNIFGAGNLQIDAELSTDVTIGSLDIHGAMGTENNWDGPAYVIEKLGGQPSTAWRATPAIPLALTYGYWSDNRPLLREILQRLLECMNADYYTSPSGLLEIVEMPQWPLTSPLITLTDAMALEGSRLEVEDVLAPSLSNLAQSSYNYDRHQLDQIAGAVTDADRKSLLDEYTLRAMQQVTDGNLHPFFAHAQEAPPMPRATYKIAPASTDFALQVMNNMCENRLRLYRRRYRIEQVRHLRPANVVATQSTRYGLTTARNMLLVDVERQSRGAGIDLVCLG